MVLLDATLACATTFWHMPLNARFDMSTLTELVTPDSPTAMGDPNLFANLIWGIVAGILTSGVLLLMGLILKRIIIPWYQALVYQGVDLEGIWVQTLDTEWAQYHYQLTLKQHAHALKGLMTITKSGSKGSDYVQNFDVIGSAWEGFVTINMKSTDRKSLSFATALLKVGNRGAFLEGHMSYRGSTSSEVESEKTRLDRR